MVLTGRRRLADGQWADRVQPDHDRSEAWVLYKGVVVPIRPQDTVPMGGPPEVPR